MLRNLGRAARRTRCQFLNRHVGSACIGQGRFSSTSATSSTGEGTTHEFQAETKKLLDIVARSLYSEHEIFVRELISNASDALNKRKFEQLQAGSEYPDLDIRLTFNKSENMLVIEDNGVGMTEEEAIINLGTIAKSGSQDFMNAVKEEHSASAQSIIGQFGVGFYSVFMVAEEVNVTSRRWDSDIGLHWTSSGEGGYRIRAAENLPTGTRIELRLKPEYREFADPDHVKKVAQKYSSFTAFPLYCAEEHINQIEPIWMRENKDITDEMHLSFFRHLTGDQKEYRFKFHFKTEMPISVRSIFYVPMERPNFGSANAEENKSEVALYCRKVLINNKTDMILPSYLRFMKGVVDSEDIPLNLSRELLQNTPLIAKIRETLTDRVIKFLNDRAKRQADEYKRFYAEHKYFISEGIVMEAMGGNMHRKDELAKLLRYESSALEAGELTSLDEYTQRMKEDQRYIFFLPSKTRQQALSSPYLDSIKNKGYEVLFFYDMFDEIVAEQMGKFKDKMPFSIENDIIDDAIDGENVEDALKDDAISTTDQERLVQWAKEKLGGKAKDVSMTSKLETQPGMITVWNLGVTRNFIRQQRMTNPEASSEMMQEDELARICEPKLQLSKTNPIILKLHSLVDSDPETAELLLMYIYNSSMINAGIQDDAVMAVAKSSGLIEKLLEKL